MKPIVPPDVSVPLEQTIAVQANFRKILVLVFAVLIVACLSAAAWLHWYPNAPSKIEEDRVFLMIPFQTSPPKGGYTGPYGLVSYSLTTGSTTPLSHALPQGGYIPLMSADARTFITVVRQVSGTPSFSIMRVALGSGEHTILATSSTPLFPTAVSVHGEEVAYLTTKLAVQNPPLTPGALKPNIALPGSSVKNLYIPPQDLFVSLAGASETHDIAKNVTPFAFSPDGQQLLVGQDGHLALIDFSSGVITPLQTSEDFALASHGHVAVSADGAYLAIFGGEETTTRIAVIDWAGKRVTQTVNIPLNASSAAFASSRLMLAEPTGSDVTLHTYQLSSRDSSPTVTPIAEHVYPIPANAYLISWLSGQ